jgi:hypothetical protein
VGQRSRTNIQYVKSHNVKEKKNLIHETHPDSPP